MNEEQPIFKVTDRRLFNADGSPREIEREEEATAAAGETKTDSAPASANSATASATSAQTATQSAAAAAPAASSTQQESDAHASGETAATAASGAHAEQTSEDDYAEGDLPGADDPASFINFLMSIASNAAAALGMMEHPVTGQRSVDPELGKHWIDILGMLKEKTRGNLAPQEQQIFEGLLADLRMQYVSLSSAPPAKPSRGFSGSDITGGR